MFYAINYIDILNSRVGSRLFACSMGHTRIQRENVSPVKPDNMLKPNTTQDDPNILFTEKSSNATSRGKI